MKEVIAGISIFFLLTAISLSVKAAVEEEWIYFFMNVFSATINLATLILSLKNDK